MAGVALTARRGGHVAVESADGLGLLALVSYVSALTIPF
jgi:hypothetical protein